MAMTYNFIGGPLNGQYIEVPKDKKRYEVVERGTPPNDVPFAITHVYIRVGTTDYFVHQQ
jgi:hypothetical protein